LPAAADVETAIPTMTATKVMPEMAAVVMVEAATDAVTGKRRWERPRAAISGHQSSREKFALMP